MVSSFEEQYSVSQFRWVEFPNKKSVACNEIVRVRLWRTKRVGPS